MREHIHLELLNWLKQSYSKTNDWRYQVLQKLAVKQTQLSPKAFCGFNTNFASTAHNLKLTYKEVRKFVNFSPIPYQTENIMFPPKLNYPMDVYFEFFSLTYAPNNYLINPQIWQHNQEDYDEFNEYE